MGSVFLSDLRQRFYDLMDEGQGQNYVSPAQADQYINNAIALLHNFIVTEDPWRIYKEYNYAPMKGQASLDLPEDFRDALKVYAIPTASNGLRYIPLRRFNASQYGSFSPEDGGLLSNPVPSYRIMGNSLRLDPAPANSPVGYTVALWYTPQAPVLKDTSSVYTYTGTQGHEQWIVNQAVIYAKMKEEVSFADVAAINAAIREDIRRDLALRDRGANDMLVDSEGLMHDTPMGMGWWS